MKQYIDFVDELYPKLRERYEIYSTLRQDPESLIGKKVISIRGGFSSHIGGQIMTISEISFNEDYGVQQIILKPNELSTVRLDSSGWGSTKEEAHNDFILYKE